MADPIKKATETSKKFLEEQKRRAQQGPSQKKKKNKKLLSAEEFFKIKDSNQKFTGPKSTKGSLGDTINQFREMDNKIISSLKMAKGGRVGLKSGSKGCKLAMKGKGKAYGKNS